MDGLIVQGAWHWSDSPCYVPWEDPKMLHGQPIVGKARYGPAMTITLDVFSTPLDEVRCPSANTRTRVTAGKSK